MKKILMATLVAATWYGCAAPEEKQAEMPMNNDWRAQNLLGMVKSVESTPYTPDSSGSIGQPDSCCISLESYDEKGYTTGFESKTSAGEPSRSMSMTRYEGGQPKEMTNTYNGKVANSFKIDIDAAGKFTKATSFDSSGTMDRYYTDISENEYGAVLGAVAHKADGSLLESFESTYKGPLMTSNITKDSAGNVKSEYTVELDDKGNEVKSTYVEHGKDSVTTTVKTYTYDSYDEAGNWTQRTEYNDKGKATKVTKRTITYYTKEE